MGYFVWYCKVNSMTVLNNWITHNLHDRLRNQSLDLEIMINPYKFTPLEFHDAANFTATKIAEEYKNIFLSFSGGADSDYVFHCFQRNNIEFTPIIVKTSGNQIEMSYALHTCRKFNVTPIIIDINNKEYMSIYAEDLIKKISGVGIEAIPGIIACQYAKSQNGILVIGEHMIDNDEENIWVGVNEWDYYNEIFVGEEYNIPFFNYTVEMAWAMINKIEQMPIDEWKWQTYGLDFRPKIHYTFPHLFNELRTKLSRSRKIKPKSNFILGSKEKVITLLESYYK